MKSKASRMGGDLKDSYHSLENKIEERMGDLSALYASMAPLVSSDADDLLQKVVERLKEATQADAALIRIFEKTTKSFLYPAHVGFPSSYLEATQDPRKNSAIDTVFMSGEPIISEDIAKDPRLKSKRQLDAGFRSCAFLPLKISGELRGIVHLASCEVGHFSAEKTDHLMAIARQMGVAMENRELLEESKKRAQEQAALSAIAMAASQSLEIHEMLQNALGKVLEVTGRERGSIRLKDPVTGQVTLSAHRGFSQEEVEELFRRTSHRMSEEVFASGKPVVVNNDSSGLGAGALLPYSRSVAWIPIKARQTVAGVLGVSAGRPIPFSQSEVDFLQAIGDVIGVALENARLFQETERRNRELQSLYTVTSTITQSLHIESLMQAALETTIDVLGVDAGRLYVLDEKRQGLRLAAYHGLPVDEVSGIERYASGEGIIGKTFMENRPIAFADMDSDPNYAHLSRAGTGRNWGFRSAAGLPITIREKPVGVIYVYGRTVREFTSRDMELLSAIGGQIGFAIENARLYEESQRSIEEQRALREFLSNLLFLDLDELLQRMTQQAALLFKAEYAWLRLFDDEGRIVTRAVAGDEEVVSLMSSLREKGRLSGRGRWMLDSRKPLAIKDIAQDVDRSSRGVAAGLHGFLGAPLFSRDQKPLGVLHVMTRSPHEFSQRDLDLIEQFAKGAAIAIEKTRLFQETEHRAREQAALNAIAIAVSHSLHLEEIFDTALDKVLEVTGRERGYIRLKNPATGEVTLAAHKGISQEHICALVHGRTPGGKSDAVFASGQALVINDTETTPLKESTLGDRLHSVVWVPMKAHGTVVGILNVATSRPIPFSPQEVDLLQAIGNVIGVALENARFFQETERNLERVRALGEIGQAITSTLDLRNVLDVLLEKIDLSLPYATATIRLFSKKSGLLEPVACRNLDEKEWKVEQWKAGRGPANVVFETNAPMMIRNCYSDPRVRDPEFFRKHELVSYLGVPMVAKEEVLGVLSFYKKEEHEYTGEVVEFLSTLAGQAAIAIYNARLYEETERRRREAEELARVAQSLTGTLDMAAVGEQIVMSVRELFGVKVSILRLLQPDGSLHALASSGEAFSRSPGGDTVSPGMGLTSRAIAERRPIWSVDMLNDPEICLTDQMRDYQLRSGNRSMIAVPLRAHEKILGALALSDQTGRIYSASEAALVQTFADQAALALENARLYEETRTRESQLRETNRMLSALHEVAAAAAETLDLDRVFQVAIEKITDMFRFDATRIHIYDERKEELVLRAAFNSDPDRFTTARSFKTGRGIVGKVAESGKALIFEDVETDPVYSQLSRTKVSDQFGYHFFGVFPIKGKLKNLGTLGCVGTAPRKLTSGEVQFLEAIADRVAVAIENSGLYEQLRQNVRELQKKTTELEAANSVKDEFLSVMSHELRTPLNVIMGYTGMIKDGMMGDTTPEQATALEKVMSRTGDLLTMITSILYATSIEANEIQVDRHPLALVDFLNELKAVNQIPLSKPLTLQWDYPSDLPTVETDREKLRHVLQNLIHNAIKFTDRGHVTLSARIREGGHQGVVVGVHPKQGNRGNQKFIEFEVKDTGIGIPKEKFPLIFERFRQADSSETRLYGGAGLGLYIAKNFAELLGGRIDVETEVGKGSTFTVSIPCVSHWLETSDKQEKERECLNKAEANHLSPSASNLRPERV